VFLQMQADVPDVRFQDRSLLSPTSEKGAKRQSLLMVHTVPESRSQRGPVGPASSTCAKLAGAAGCGCDGVLHEVRPSAWCH
jgi:hypothetical protein